MTAVLMAVWKTWAVVLLAGCALGRCGKGCNGGQDADRGWHVGCGVATPVAQCEGRCAWAPRAVSRCWGLHGRQAVGSGAETPRLKLLGWAQTIQWCTAATTASTSTAAAAAAPALLRRQVGGGDAGQLRCCADSGARHGHTVRQGVRPGALMGRFRLLFPYHVAWPITRGGLAAAQCTWASMKPTKGATPHVVRCVSVCMC